MKIDCVSIRRAGGDGGTSGEMNRVTITIMQELDRITGRQIIIGATNRLDVLDDAILRRFSKHHEVTIPQDPKEAQKVISVLLDDAGVKYDRAEIFNWCADHDDKPQHGLLDVLSKRLLDLLKLVIHSELSGVIYMTDRSKQTKMKAIIEFFLIFILSASLILLFMSGLYLLYALYYCNTLDQLTEVLTNPN